MAFILKSGTQVQLGLELADVDGNPITPSGPITWASSDAAIVGVDANGLAADPVGAGLGTATITAEVDGFTGTIDITTVAGDAAIANITTGTPEPRV